MGCGISKPEVEDGGRTAVLQVKSFHRRNDRAVADSTFLSQKLLEGGGKEEAHRFLANDQTNKGDNVILKEPLVGDINSEDKEGTTGRAKPKKEDQYHKEENAQENEGKDQHERNDSIFYPGSPSFREYCIDYESEESKNEVNSVESIGKKRPQEEDPNNNMGSRVPIAKRGKKGRGFSTGSAKVRSFLRV